jgi:hypothetical protein
MNIMDIYLAPSKVFNILKDKPQWVKAFLIVLVVVALAAILTMVLSRETIIAQQEDAMRERGVPEEQIEQAMQFTSGPAAMLIGAVFACGFVAATLGIFALVTNLFIPMFGGASGFKKVFSVICFSALVIVPATILKIILIAINKSPYVTTSLALLAPNLAKNSFGYQLLAGFDFFIIWEMILVAMGISITNNITRKNAYILIGVIWVISIFIQAGFGSIFRRAM